jgi:hypothetical protein
MVHRQSQNSTRQLSAKMKEKEVVFFFFFLQYAPPPPPLLLVGKIAQQQQQNEGKSPSLSPAIVCCSTQVTNDSCRKY